MFVLDALIKNIDDLLQTNALMNKHNKSNK